MDQWGIIYGQPLVLNRRQAGVAIEGVVRQEHRTLEKLAVDTHGYTDFAMAIAKLLGFDLCPRLARLSERKLYVPRGTDVPDVLKSVVRPTISSRHLRGELDGLVRIAASIHGGWCSAVLALDRYGSASRGDPIYQAGQALGQLVRTLYLCDYFLNPYFRTLILKVLNYGESIDTLQRAVHAGPIGAKRGRRPEELRAITGSLSLLTNIVLAWNTHRMEDVVAKGQWNDTETTDASVLSHIPPVHYDHINLGGIFLFLLRKYRGTLVERRQDQTRIGAARDRKL